MTLTLFRIIMQTEEEAKSFDLHCSYSNLNMKILMQ